MFVVFIEETRDDFEEKTENVLHSFYLNRKMFPFYALLSAVSFVCALWRWTRVRALKRASF
jgi:hypothetical protein